MHLCLWDLKREAESGEVHWGGGVCSWGEGLFKLGRGLHRPSTYKAHVSLRTENIGERVTKNAHRFGTKAKWKVSSPSIPHPPPPPRSQGPFKRKQLWGCGCLDLALGHQLYCPH